VNERKYSITIYTERILVTEMELFGSLVYKIAEPVIQILLTAITLAAARFKAE